MSSATATPVHEVDLREIEQLLARAKQGPLSAEDRELIWSMAVSYLNVGEMLKNKSASLKQLRQALFGSSSEKLEKVLNQGGGTNDPAADGALGDDSAKGEPEPDRQKPPPEPKKGHGRNGADAYTGATRIVVQNLSLHGGDACPCCSKGRVYPMSEPQVLVRVTGAAPLQAKVYEIEQLRCSSCSEVFPAKAPDGVGEEKYDAPAASMIAMLRYGSGMPSYRLEQLQKSVGIPLPASTQWDIVESFAETAEPAYAELVRQAAQGEIVHNDDTPMRVLELLKKRKEQERAAAEGKSEQPKGAQGKERTGIFTTGIVSVVEGRRIALYFTGSQHAGENLKDVLCHRAKELAPPIQMCDALPHNLPGELEVILANCLTHGRRKFVYVSDDFPAECRHVLEELAKVYRTDAEAKSLGLSAQERLALHQDKSGPVMDDLKKWLRMQIDEHKVEPNSTLGKAICYMQKHWNELTLFLRQAGAPLDNNICEQILKRAILHRKNSMFYKTLNGAKVGDLFMSLIHTAGLCGANTFHYLNELQHNAAAVRNDPAAWMPWRYRETLAAVAPP